MSEGKKVRLAGIAYESLVNGPGIRRVLFAQGCRHNCEGCFNPDTHCFTGGNLFESDELVADILSNPMLRGVTFSGGDPFEQAGSFYFIAKSIKDAGLDVWSYTGYKFEYILDNLDKNKGWKKLISKLDVLVDGKYIQELKNPRLRFRGSTNQRIIDVKESLRTGLIKILKYDN